MGVSVSTVIAFHEATIPESRHSCTLQHLQLWWRFFDAGHWARFRRGTDLGPRWQTSQGGSRGML